MLNLTARYFSKMTFLRTAFCLVAILFTFTVSAAKATILVPFAPWFNEIKVGMFIHGGLYSIPAGTWKGQIGTRPELVEQEFRIPISDYSALAKEFNPVKFDANTYVKLAKDAGFGYLVLWPNIMTDLQCLTRHLILTMLSLQRPSNGIP